MQWRPAAGSPPGVLPASVSLIAGTLSAVFLVETGRHRVSQGGLDLRVHPPAPKVLGITGVSLHLLSIGYKEITRGDHNVNNKII